MRLPGIFSLISVSNRCAIHRAPPPTHTYTLCSSLHLHLHSIQERGRQASHRCPFLWEQFSWGPELTIGKIIRDVAMEEWGGDLSPDRICCRPRRWCSLKPGRKGTGGKNWNGTRGQIWKYRERNKSSKTSGVELSLGCCPKLAFF